MVWGRKDFAQTEAIEDPLGIKTEGDVRVQIGDSMTYVGYRIIETMRLKPSYRGLLILTLLGVIFNLVSERSLVKSASWQQEEVRRSETAPRLLSPRASDRHPNKRAENTSSNTITLKEGATSPVTSGSQHNYTVMVESSISTLAIKEKARFPRNASLASAGHHDGATKSENSTYVNATETVKSRNSSNYYQYHEWGEKFNTSATIQLLPLLQLINKTFEPRKHVIYGPFPVFVAVQNNTPSLWISSQTMSWNKRDTILKKRLAHVLPHFQRALQVQLYQHQEQFPALMKALATVGSIPLFFDLSDYIGCCNPDNRNDMVVLYNYASPPPKVAYFTMSKPVSCNFGFPIPSSYTYKYATTLIDKKHRTWEGQTNAWNNTYPWESKIAQVYWIGIRSGRFLTHRLKFFQQVVADDEQHNVTHQNQSIFNVHPTWRDDECGPGKCPPVTNSAPQEESMKYKATFDLDGHSWSERFPRLLCYNSAVIKLDVPHENEEYFMGHTVFPGIHYIPADLDNFTQVARMVLDPSNDEMLREVVRNANAWCVERMNEESLNLDFLSALNGYVGTLYEGWMEEWKRVLSAYVGPGLHDAGHGGFYDTVVSNSTTDTYYPNVTSLEGSTSWNLHEYIVDSGKDSQKEQLAAARQKRFAVT